MSTRNKCINCGRDLQNQQGIWICSACNTQNIDEARIFIDENDNDEYVFIECPGATLYEENSTNVISGVKFHDNNNPLKGHQIIGDPVFAPNHKHRRRIKREAIGSIRRCRACQDYTIRMRRKEGADFFIPSNRHPRRKKLKSITHLTYEP